jgi:hypothetical protein
MYYRITDYFYFVGYIILSWVRTSRLRIRVSVGLWVVGLIFVGRLPLGAVDSVEYVPARSYFDVARQEIGQAKSSVILCLYLFSLRSTAAEREVFQLAQALVNARNAGAHVEVYLDNNVSGELDDVRGFNRPASDFLRGQGISVYQDDVSAVAHAKAIVIDHKVLLLGSSNWTGAALNKNFEGNVLVHSTAAAQAFLRDLHRQTWHKVSDSTGGASGEVPLSFLKDPKLFRAMVMGRDERALDVALWLFFKQSTGTFTVKLDDVASFLGMNEWTREASRRQIIKTLNKLQNRYRLIRVDHSFSGDSRVTWTYVKEGIGVTIPEGYWTLGWNRRLSLTGKCFFLISQAESAAAVTRPRWSAARTTLGERYHLFPSLLSRGVTELRRQNLLEVEYGPLGKNGPHNRPPNIYTPNPPYDFVRNQNRLTDLTARVGADTVARAQSAASLIYEDNDLDILEELIELESRYGRARMEHALAVLSRMNVDNPKRNFPYLKGIVQTE